MKHVVLLRGVNVGGKRRVPKAEFALVLESLGFRDVLVYINSGNAVFTNDTVPTSSDVKQALEAHFGFVIATLVVPGSVVKSIAAAIPTDWTNDPLRPDKSGYKSDVLYLFDSVDTPEIIEKLGYKPDLETMLYVDGAVLTTISRANQSKGSLAKIVGTPLYQSITVRNITTARKLAELC